MRNVVFPFAAIMFPDDQFLGDIYKTSGKVTGVGSTQSSIGQTFTGSMSRDEILQNIESFTEIGLDRKFDGTS